MREWSYWDWLGYGCLAIAVLVEAGNTSLKSAPDLSNMLPSIFTGSAVGYLPLVFFMAATIILVLRALGWLSRKQLPPQYAPPIAWKRQVGSNGSLKDADKIYSSTVTMWNPKGLYVGQMGFDIPKLDSEFYGELWLRAFNASGVSIAVKDIKGRVRYKAGPKPEDMIELPSAPALLRERSETENMPDRCELMLVFEQRVPKDIAIKILSEIEGGKSASLDLNGLDVSIGPTNSGAKSRLPLWSGLTLSKPKERVFVGRITEVRLEAAALTIGAVKPQPQ